MLNEQHVLDNPVWEALQTGNNALSLGTETVKIFPPAISPLAGLKENKADNFDALFKLSKPDQVVILFTTKELQIPKSWKIITCLKGYQ